MASITLKGNSINTIGQLPKVGSSAPNFLLRQLNLSNTNLSDFQGSKVVLNIFPSLDTGTCAASVRKFNEEASKLNNTKILCISKDLPFAHARFCETEGIKNVINLSDISGEFGKKYQVEITDGPLEGLHSRAIIVLDEKGTVLYSEQVPEIVDEPNYEAALKAIQ